MKLVTSKLHECIATGNHFKDEQNIAKDSRNNLELELQQLADQIV
jgi:hypothetical protein